MNFNPTNVYQRQLSDWEIYIFFTLHNQNFALYVKQLYDEETDTFSSFFIPHYVYHYSSEVVHNCPVCDEEAESLCNPLCDDIENLFLRLIELPSIRLEWLFREYKLEELT